MPMKDGAGDLDFGQSSDDDDQEADSEPKTESSESEQPPARSSPTREPTDQSTPDLPTDPSSEYPYFVRRSKVMDERTERIEIHLRKQADEKRSDFRSELAEELDTDEISKSDAREFALLYAFENPEGVAELMRDEGFGLVD